MLISDKQLKQMKTDYESCSKTVSELAIEYGIANGTVYKYLNKIKAKMRVGKFTIGNNAWANLTPEQVMIRKKKFSDRMRTYNPMFNPDIQKRRAFDEKRRRGATGRLTHRERRLLIEEVGKCERCGIKDPLTVHHRDGNRYNNNRINLFVCCYNCHYLVHRKIREERKQPNRCGW